MTHHFLFTEAELSGAHTVDVELEGGIVDVLGDEDVGDTGDGAELSGEVGGDFVGSLHVGADDLDIDGGDFAEVEDGFDLAAGGEKAASSGSSFSMRCLTRWT
jgi:hypothetical protein